MNKRKLYQPNLLGLWELECDDEKSFSGKSKLKVEKCKNHKTGKAYYNVSLGGANNTNKDFAEKVISICKSVEFEIVKHKRYY